MPGSRRREGRSSSTKRPAAVLMVQGTMSSVGKSWLVAGLARWLARQGVRVAPFKAQNMSNNAAVTPQGGEIGRAQAMQARAAGVPPHVDMNPILLKPEAEARAQVVVRGKPWRTLAAGDYYQVRAALWPVVTAALDRLRARYEVVLIEGAGSPAELNLRDRDMVNMAIARYAHAPVLLVGDIERGGIFAQLLGTLDLLPPEERRLVRGLVVNKFRGDPALFADGVRLLEARSGLPVLGVVPYLPHVVLPEEDAATLDTAAPPTAPPTVVDLAVVRLPRVANFDDLDPLRATPGVRVRWVDRLAAWGRPHAVLLPGSKSTLADLTWLRQSGLAARLQAFAAQGGAVVGLCGGYQMLGQRIADPHGLETQGEAPGLALLPVETHFVGPKVTAQTQAVVRGGPGWLAPLVGEVLHGYEIHFGRTATPVPWLTFTQRNGRAVHEPDGAVTAHGRVWGTYLHGIFANDAFRAAWLASLAAPVPHAMPAAAADPLDAALDALADALAQALDLQPVMQWLGL